MKDKKNITIGVALHDAAGQPYTHNVTSISFDRWSMMWSFSVEKGEKVEHVFLSTEVLQQLGVIDIQRLEGVIK